MSSQHIFIHAIVVAKADKADEVKKALQSIVSVQVANEPDTLYYKVIQDAKDQTRFYVHEEYKDKAALDLHMKGKEFQSLVARVQELCAEPPVINQCSPI